MNYAGKRLSTVPYEDITVGMEVVSVVNTPGKVVSKSHRETTHGTDWVYIDWDNGNKAILPHSMLTCVTVKEEPLDDDGVVKMFESVIEEDVTAYNRPGEIIYQVTQKELLKFAGKLLDKKKEESVHE
jgi:hypothetical protein